MLKGIIMWREEGTRAYAVDQVVTLTWWMEYNLDEDMTEDTVWNINL